MSLYNGPARGGNRGGKDQFNWESVKSDKDREFYLGHSVKATTGRWQKGKDVFWYTRDKTEEALAREEELRAVKQREEELMLEALGIKPKKAKQLSNPKLDRLEVNKLLGRTEEEEEPDPAAETVHMKGLGYAPMGMAVDAGPDHEVLQGEGLTEGRAAVQAPEAGGNLPPLPPKLTAEQLQQLLKEQKRAVKRAKKDARKARRALKKVAKEKKRKKKGKDKDKDRTGEERPAKVEPGSRAKQDVGPRGTRVGGAAPSSADASTSSSDDSGQSAPASPSRSPEPAAPAAKRRRHDTLSPEPAAVRTAPAPLHQRGIKPDGDGRTRRRHDTPEAEPRDLSHRDRQASLPRASNHRRQQDDRQDPDPDRDGGLEHRRKGSRSPPRRERSGRSRSPVARRTGRGGEDSTGRRGARDSSRDRKRR